MGNSSLEASHTAENPLPAVKTTSRPEDFHSMDNVLAAEKPPDAPLHEANLNKDDFLFDPWKGAGGGGAARTTSSYWMRAQSRSACAKTMEVWRLRVSSSVSDLCRH
ncbi:hypothetical protein PBY51_016525 [Eleginops maclovinus]|uniref:Uncharacterized protein n=1 Tax=Eleginops maclovinus TaxID=56733 RepID=A0AAN8A8C3_ELEMC|nr:hypothetical protein PBY51_016525 [Eleginops maclovinus]